MNANAFASTFAFFTTHEPTLKKAKELASHRTGHRKDSANLTQQTFVDREARTANMGLNEMAGEVVSQTVVLSINICGGWTVCASNPPLRQAPKPSGCEKSRFLKKYCL